MGKDLNGKEIGRGLTQRQDGLYQARFTSVYRDEDGGKIRRQKSFRYLEDAKEWLDREMFDDRYCGVKAGPDMTVRSLFKTWIEQHNNVKETTRDSYESVWRNQLDSLLGDFKVKEVKMMHIQDIVNKLYQKGYSEKTIGNTKTMIGTMFKYAEANDLILKNPCSSMITVPKGGRGYDRLMVLTQDEADDLVAHLPDGRYKNMAILILNTGLRIGEVCGLMWKDIDFISRELHVNRSVWRSKTEGNVLGEPKTKNSVRTIPLTTDAMKALKNAKADRRKLRTNVFAIEYGELVFPSDNGGILDRSGFDQMLKLYCKFSGMPNFSAHCLRHTFATRCVEAGMDYKTLQELMGHSSIRITMDTYVHIDNESKREGIEKLEKKMRRIG